MIKAPRGTYDVLPDEQPRWQHVVSVFSELSRQYGYAQITTPVIEHRELIERTSGQGSDIVQKEIYTFEDRSGRALALRPEATAPVARAYVEHGFHRRPQPVKTYMVGPMLRYERPQKGRYREHWQLNIEAMGSDDPAVDAEVVQLYSELLRRLGVQRYWIELNSIGDRNCRPGYLERLETWLDDHDDALDADARAKRNTSPLRVFDTKNPNVQEALEDAPKIGESLCADCMAHFAEVRRYLDAFEVAYRVKPTLVRGLDYYTRTTFEFIGEALGAQDVICGGGRYDYLVEEIGGPPTPGIGFGAGVERLLLQLEEEGAEQPRPEQLDVFFVCDADAPRERVFALMAKLRRRGKACDADYAGRSLKGQLTHASRLDSEAVVVVRGSEGTIRRAGQEDVAVPLDELGDAL
jgi:histidyl-tRNA synthetase